MRIRQLPPELDTVEEVPEADAAEQHADLAADKEAEVDHPVDDERVVVLDDDEYR